MPTGTPEEVTKSPRVTVEEHRAAVEAVRANAEALPTEAVRAPDMPIQIFLGEMDKAAAAAIEHKKALVAVGLEEQFIENMLRLCTGLSSAQSLWLIERSRGKRSAELFDALDRGEKLRQEVLAAGDLALRKSPEGQERLAYIREGEGVQDLINDLSDLALLLTDARPLFEKIKVNVDEKAKACADARDELRVLVSDDAVGRTITDGRDLRDRIYTLALESLQELRAFAAFAFRNDSDNRRRGLFTSHFHRSRARKYRKNARARAEAKPVVETN